MTEGLAFLIKPPPVPRSWRAERREQQARIIRGYAERGMTMHETAPVMGLSYARLSALARQNGITFVTRYRPSDKRAKPDPVRLARIRDMRAQGMTLEQIAEKEGGITRERVRQLLVKAGGDPQPVLSSGFHHIPRVCCAQCGELITGDVAERTSASSKTVSFCTAEHYRAFFAARRFDRATRGTVWSRLAYQAFQMRAEGKTWQQIGDALGYPYTGIHGRAFSFARTYGIDVSWATVGKGVRTPPVAPPDWDKHPIWQSIAARLAA